MQREYAGVSQLLDGISETVSRIVPIREDYQFFGDFDKHASEEVKKPGLAAPRNWNPTDSGR